MAEALELVEKEKKLTAKVQVSEKIKLKSGPLTMHFQHSGAKIRGFGQKKDTF